LHPPGCRARRGCSCGSVSRGTLELEVHPGFPDVLSACGWVEGLGSEPGLAALVRFLGGWYVVLYDTLEREVVAGSELVWYTKNFVLECAPAPSFRLPYAVRSLTRAYGWREGVWEDLLRVDPGLGVYLVRYRRLSPGVVGGGPAKVCGRMPSCRGSRSPAAGGPLRAVPACCGGTLPGRSRGRSGSAGAATLWG